MKVLICGIDGYLGWPLALHLDKLGHEVVGMDAGWRRIWVQSVLGQSIIPIRSWKVRQDHTRFSMIHAELLHKIDSILQFYKPDAIVHLAEQPSAPFSMIDSKNAELTQHNNVIGTLAMLFAINKHCRHTHLLKIGTMGEYGTPDCVIPEAGPHEFPRQPGSFYHVSKVCDSVNIEFACRSWGLRSTDVMQGVVYGTRTDEIMEDPKNNATRFDVDECFGTVINRFCAQAVIKMPLTVYGTGQQIRGFLPLKDSIQCLTIALENPPNEGEYRVFNQFEEVYSIRSLAAIIELNARNIGLDVETQFLDNPRVEADSHKYSPRHQKLFDLGYKPTNNLRQEIEDILTDLLPHKKRIESIRLALFPKTRWRAK